VSYTHIKISHFTSKIYTICLLKIKERFKKSSISLSCCAAGIITDGDIAFIFFSVQLKLPEPLEVTCSEGSKHRDEKTLGAHQKVRCMHHGGESPM
jgi:hypothetical protein